MAAAIETVTAFLAACGKGKPAMQEAFRTYFTPATVWENVGFSITTGADEAVALMEQAEAGMGIASFRAETLAIVTQGEKVLTERIDYMQGADGTDQQAIRLMGIFEVRDGRITAWRDYFDTAVLTAGG